jgi:capsular exopolysaccharide synthesis family protein
MVSLNRLVLALYNAWWIVVAATGLAGLMAYHSARQTPPTYVATTTLLVGDVLRSPKPGDGEFSVAQNLANGYAQLAQRQPILEATVKALNLPFNWEELRRRVVVVHPNGALTIEVRVMDTQPTRSRDIAANIAQQLVTSSPTTMRREEADQRRQYMRDEMADLQTRIQQAREDIDKKRAALAQETNARAVLDRQEEIKAAEQKLDGWRASYNTLLAAMEGRGDPNSLTIIEPAVVPTSPTTPKGAWYVLLAALGGFLIALLGIVAVEYFNDLIRSREDLRKALRENAEGLIAYIPRQRNPNKALSVIGESDSLAGDAFRLLAAQLRFAVLGAGPHLLMVTSARKGEGKSTTAANLAAALALGGTKTLLIDLDLRKPGLHSLFNVPNRGGAATMLLSRDFTIDRFAVPTTLPNLRLIPAGTVIGNPPELLSRSGEALLLSAWASAEVVIVDGPPLLAVPDVAVLAGYVPDMLCVTRFERTSGRDLRAAVDVLQGLPARLRAIILNAVPSEQASLSGYRFEEPGRALGGWSSFGRGAGRIAAAASGMKRAVPTARPLPVAQSEASATLDL